MRTRFLLTLAAFTLMSFGVAGGQSLSLDHVDGLNTSGGLETDVPVTFHLRVRAGDNSYSGITNGFRIYSETAQWGSTVGDSIGTLGMTQFDGGFFINEFSLDGTGADTVGFAAFRFFYEGLPAGFDDVAYTIQIGPISATYEGAVICLDSAFFPPTGVWKWAGPQAYPAWDGPHCFTVGGGPPPAGPSISLDHVDGMNLNGELLTGEPVVFHLGVASGDRSYDGIVNGFRVYSETAQWGTTVGDTTGALGMTQFDGGFFINPYSVNGSGADTVGFAAFVFFNDGIPAGFDDVAFTIGIGPIDESDAGGIICLDSAYFPPSGVWKWAGPDAYPDWDGPHCFLVAEGGSPEPGTLHVPSDDYPTIISALNAATDGDTILVGPGVYSGPLDFGGKTIVLISEEGAEATKIVSPVPFYPIQYPEIDTLNSGRTGADFREAFQVCFPSAVIEIPSGSGPGIVILGFTIDGSNYTRGICCIESDITVSHCIVQNCRGPYDGGGMFFERCAPTITHNIIRENYTPITGGGIFVRLGIGYGTAVASYNECYNNKSGNGPAISFIQGGDGLITRNVCYDNIAEGSSEIRGAIYFHADNVQATNNTMHHNTAGLTYLSSQDCQILNNIMSSNIEFGLHARSYVGPNINVIHDYNDIWNTEGQDYFETTPAPHEICADPRFGPEFTLLAGSPCIDAGHPDPVYNDPDGSRNDMGAKPFEGEGQVVIPTNEWISVYCHHPIFEDRVMAPGDVIRAYDPAGILCGKDVVKDDGSFGFMPIYRDDIYTRRDEGAEPGDVISFTVNGQSAATDPAIVWTNNFPTFEACYFFTQRCVDITLNAGWNLISWNVDYADEVAEAIAEIADSVDIILSFHQGALVYDPKLPEFSTLETMDYYHSYWIRMACDTTLEICGGFIDAAESIYIYRGWNMVGYWPDEVFTVEVGFESILYNLQVALGYEGGGLAWLPGQGGFNTLTHLKPLHGYWVRSVADDCLVYPGFIPPPGREAPAKSVTLAVAPSRAWMSLYGRGITLDGEELPANATVEAYTEDGVRCGQGQYHDGLLKFTPVYGFDDLDEMTSAYPRSDDPVAVYIDGARTYPDIVWAGDGNRVELGERLSRSGSEGPLPDDYALRQNYPNPFNPVTTIGFALPTAGHVELVVYNVLGQKVATIVDGTRGAGHHEVSWQGVDDGGSRVTSGIYFYRLTTSNYTETKKMMLVK